MAKEPWPKLEAEWRKIDLRTLKRREVNARYMPPEEHARLVENIRLDGRLTGGVLACLSGAGTIEILSGHNRAECSIEAGCLEGDVLVITTPLSEERKVAIQLSHNAVVGKDNPTVLAEMYRGLGLSAKMFSGLTDDVLDYDKLTVGGFAPGLQYEELLLAFLPDDREAFEQALRRVRKSNRLVSTHFARFKDFDVVFDAIIKVKEAREIINSAMTLSVLAELAMERLDQLQAEDEEAA